FRTARILCAAAERWRAFFVARWCVGFRPGRKGGDFRRAQGRIVRKFSDRWISKPRWHGFLLHGVPNRASVRLRPLIRFKRHRSDRGCAMATLAVMLKNWQNVTIKRWRGSAILMRGCAATSDAERTKQTDNHSNY